MKPEPIGIVLLAAFTLPALAQQPAQLEWDHIYTPTDLPGRFGWSGGGNPNSQTSAEITDDGALRIIDASSAPTHLHAYSHSWLARPDRGGMAQATVKVVSNTDRAGVALMVADGVREIGLTLYPDRAVLGDNEFVHPMNTTDDYHTFQLRISGMNFELWVDGTLVIDGWGKLSNPAHNGRRVVTFGSISSAAKSEALWKDVRFVSFAQPVERLAGARDVIIYRKQDVYACFPSLTRLEDGKLYTSFGTRVRRSHIDATGGGARMISSDFGETWAPTDQSYSDPRYRREDGTIFVPRAEGWVYVDEAELPKIKERGRRWMNVRPGTVAYLGDCLVDITRPDGTKEQIRMDSPVPGGMMSFHPNSAFLRKGNLWIVAIYGGASNEAETGVWAIRSEDNGENWELVHIAGPIGDKIGLGESALCDNGLGELICVMRSGDGGTYNTYQCFSSDGGKTWGPPQDTGIWGYPCNVIRLRDGRLLCTYGYRRDAMGVRAVLSSTGGHTWDLENEIILRADGYGNGGDNGYPISLEHDTEDGRIFTIYYLNDKENVTHVAGTHWQVPPAK